MERELIQKAATHFVELYKEEIVSGVEIIENCIHEWWMMTCDQYMINADNTEVYDEIEKEIFSRLNKTEEQIFLEKYFRVKVKKINSSDYLVQGDYIDRAVFQVVSQESIENDLELSGLADFPDTILFQGYYFIKQ